MVVRFRGREKKTAMEAARWKIDAFEAIGKIKHAARLNGSNYVMTIM